MFWRMLCGTFLVVVAAITAISGNGLFDGLVSLFSFRHVGKGLRASLRSVKIKSHLLAFHIGISPKERQMNGWDGMLDVHQIVMLQSVMLEDDV